MVGRRRAGAAVVAVGVVLTVFGAVLFLTADGDDGRGAAAEATTTTAGEAAATTTTAGEPTTTTAPAPTTTAAPPDPAEGVPEFFAALFQALAAGDSAHLVAALHPLVLERYGEAQCQAYLSSVNVPNAQAQVLSTDPATETWVWETDGLQTEVPEALAVVLRRTEDGSNFSESEVHVARVDGDIRWFTDCGTPGGA